jgi:hypothetical protein
LHNLCADQLQLLFKSPDVFLQASLHCSHFPVDQQQLPPAVTNAMKQLRRQIATGFSAPELSENMGFGNTI